MSDQNESSAVDSGADSGASDSGASAADPNAPTVFAGGRVRAAYLSGERAMLDGWLDFHRETLLWKCEGLSHEQLRERAVPPSELSLLGLVRHMTEVDRGWNLEFSGTSPEPVYGTPEDIDADFHGVDTADVEADLALYRATIAELRTFVADHDLDETFEEDGKRISLRWVYLHLIEEYARHNGHADLLRERLDGATGD